MDDVPQNRKNDVYNVTDDLILNECIDIIVHCSTVRNKEKTKKHLLEIFIFAKVTDFIALKDALWISDTFKLLIFMNLSKNSELYLDGHIIEHADGIRAVFGRNRKNKELHMNYGNFRQLFIHCVLSHINELLKTQVLSL